MDVDGGFGRLPVTSGLPRTSDIIRSPRHVSKVPRADIPPSSPTATLQSPRWATPLTC